MCMYYCASKSYKMWLFWYNVLLNEFFFHINTLFPFKEHRNLSLSIENIWAYKHWISTTQQQNATISDESVLCGGCGRCQQEQKPILYHKMALVDDSSSIHRRHLFG